MPQSVEDLLGHARSHLHRASPDEAFIRRQHGALLVDIRPQPQREREGEAIGTLFIERNHLEWRFDLQREWHIDQVTSYDQDIIILCSEGYTSSLAAYALQQLGFENATDIEGGYMAWKAAGLPTQPGGTPAIP
jgi:rhodanese-related sulfurtransferase